MKIVHFCAGLQFWNGMANTARQFMEEELKRGDDSCVTSDIKDIDLGVDLVYIHGAWLPILWKVAKKVKNIGAKLIIRPAGSYDPVRLAYHGWKKRLVSFFEHRMLRRADVLLATCEAEAIWIRNYEPRAKKVELTDLKRFFKLAVGGSEFRVSGNNEKQETRNEKLNLLYLGRRHPLKGVEYLEAAVSELNSTTPPLPTPPLLRIVSNAFGEEKERVWDWCDVLVLPTLSENFGRVVAEALERGKRVITTDGAPVWESLAVSGQQLAVSGQELGVGGDGCGIGVGCGGRLLYLKGYRDGTKDERVSLLKIAIERMCK